ncbi:hypothetical protein FDENT_9658 [Fusarium denticulatum]|uniref:Uncharacterized protein n=1 Tax=Fusarium denticulatum TaxID=48507 RepID=A0A8H5WU93_9HYPO|nr:hypothetical protein FDENT_9658 [Fusarium denticulatum]
MDDIAENADLAFSVLQLPLYTFVPHQISGGLDPFNGLQPSQFAIIEAREHIRTALAHCQGMSERDGTANEEIKNMTDAWDDAHNINWLYFATLPDIATAKGRETHPQAALRLTKTYIKLIEEAFMSVSDRHPNGVTMAALSEDSLDILYTVIPTRMNQLHETIDDFRRRKHALMEATSQIIEPLKACQAYLERIDLHSNMDARQTERLIHHANHIADLYKLSVSKVERAESAAKTLSRELKRKYFLRLGGDISEVAVGLSRVRNKVVRVVRTRDRALKWYRRELKRRRIEPDIPIKPEKKPYKYGDLMDDDRRPAWVRWRTWCRYSWERCGEMFSIWDEDERQHEY